jgi:hypothetical protein
MNIGDITKTIEHMVETAGVEGAKQTARERQKYASTPEKATWWGQVIEKLNSMQPTPA